MVVLVETRCDWQKNGLLNKKRATIADIFPYVDIRREKIGIIFYNWQKSSSIRRLD